LGAWPLIGYVARRAGTIFVDRSEGGKRASAALAVRRRLAEGATITVFPEGTTFTGDEVRTFHAGIFAAIRGLDVEVVPVGLAYEPGAEYREKSFVEHLGKTAGRASTRVVMCVGEPRAFEGDTRTGAVTLRQSVQQLVTRARGLHAERAAST
jgi:1-acyl-sn-glycerol-3-phosphate acyltransferase